MSGAPSTGRVDFAKVNDAALASAETVCRAFLPDGKREAREWVATNPTRPDHRRGSFKVNVTTGKWSDFATGDRGGDLVSLVAYVTGLGQREAAVRLAESLGVNPYG